MVADSILVEVTGFSFDLILPSALWPCVDSASSRNEYHDFLEGGEVKVGRSARKADNLTVFCEATVQKMWEPRRLRILRASAVYCYAVEIYVFQGR
jgi:hypothetical protein